MKKLLLLFFTINCFSQAPTIEWQKSFGGSNFDYPRNAIITSDGGYLMFGYTSSTNGDVTGNHGSSDIWIVKINSFGMLQWQKTFGGTGGESGESIRETSDGYIFVGSTNSSNGDVIGIHGSNSDAWIVKLNFSGEIQWQRTLGTTDYDYATNIIATSDGGYIVTAEKSMNVQQGPTNYHVIKYWIIKLSSNGLIQWEKEYGGIGNSYAYDILQNVDGSYMVIGETSVHNGDVVGNHSPDGSVDAWLLKLTPTGEISWQKCYGGSGYERAFRIINTIDGGYIIAGDSDSNNGDLLGTSHNGSPDIWLVKINNTGDIEWQKNYGGSGTNYAFDIFQTSDNGYMFSGYTDSTDGEVTGNHGSCDAWVVKTNNLGIIEWQKTFGGSGCDAFLNVKPTSDGGFFTSGYSSSSDGDSNQNFGSRDFWAVKLGPELNASTFDKIKLVLSPNPANKTLNLNLSNNFPVDKIIITDLSGKKIIEKTRDNDQIDVQNLSNGLYFIQIFSEGNRYLSKFIKQ